MPDSLLRLIIDTSSEYTLIGITDHHTILASEIALHANRLSQTLLPTIQTLLQQAHLSLNQIQEIAVGMGPGSYTGTRLGVAVARSLHFALQTPSLKGFCSLLAFVPPINGTFACVMPSKTGDFYLLKGNLHQDILSLSHSQLLDQTTLIQTLQAVDQFIAKPLEETKKHLSSFPWILPSPSLTSILHYLNSPTLDFPQDVIYLH